jgi:hypothetical protein
VLFFCHAILSSETEKRKARSTAIVWFSPHVMWGGEVSLLWGEGDLVSMARADPVPASVWGGKARCSRWRLASKGAWWMPRRWQPRKDAATRRNASGRRWQPVSRRYPNGATRLAHGQPPAGMLEGTGGTDTSQDPEEKRGFPESRRANGEEPKPIWRYSLPAMPGRGSPGCVEGAAVPSPPIDVEPKTAGTGHRSG